MPKSLWVLTSALTIALPVAAQQVADTTFSPPIARPAYAFGRGPVVLIDEAHNNFHTADGRYLAFARLLRRDGYVVRPNKTPLSKAALDGARVLVIANALHERNRNDWELPTPSAFTPDEIAAVREWVAGGGSLFLIADHMPMPGAIDHLAAAFGVFWVNGFAQDSTRQDGSLTFRRSNASLATHAIVNGRSQAERVDSVTSFTGSAFRTTVPVDTLLELPATTIVLMPQVAWQFSNLTPRLAGAGMLQGAVLSHGRGRVAVFGEAAMFSAQVAGPQRRPMGMNDPAAPQNAQFLLNVMHWLSGVGNAGHTLTDASVLLSIENDWNDARKRKDVAWFDRIITDDATSVSAGGAILSKAQFLESIRADKSVLESIELAEPAVRVDGNTAIVTGINRLRGRDEQGKPFDRRVRFTGTYVKRDGRWLVWAFQGTSIP